MFWPLNAVRNALCTAFNGQNKFMRGVLTPNDYRESSKGTLYKATTFGVRDTATHQWKFYSQRYRPENMGPPVKYGLKEVIEVQTA